MFYHAFVVSAGCSSALARHRKSAAGHNLGAGLDDARSSANPLRGAHARNTPLLLLDAITPFHLFKESLRQLLLVQILEVLASLIVLLLVAFLQQ